MHFQCWPDSRCSSATTLIMHRLKFGGQQFAKCPDMIRQSSGHPRCARAPLWLDQSRGIRRRLRQRQTQTHVRPCEVVERLKQGHAPAHLGAILTETPAFAHQRCQSMTQGKVETFDQTGADRESQLLQPLGATAHAIDQLLQTSFALLFDYLAIDQIGVRFLHRLLRASWLARARKGLFGDVDALQYYAYELPDGSIIYADKAYNDYEIEDLLKEVDHIQLLPMRKKNSQRALSSSISFVQSYHRKRVETAGSLIAQLLPKSIHAVTSQGFELKVALFVIASSLNGYFNL